MTNQIECGECDTVPNDDGTCRCDVECLDCGDVVKVWELSDFELCRDCEDLQPRRCEDCGQRPCARRCDDYNSYNEDYND